MKLSDMTGLMSFKGIMKSVLSCCIMILFIIVSVGCSEEPAAPPARVVQPPVTTPAPVPAPAPAAVKEEEAPKQEGYVYKRNDRRDPFIPLVVPKKRIKKSKDIKVGTLESYDVSEFKLGAIVKKGKEYIALLTTPDNRSFTVRKGVIIGLNKGKIKKVMSNKLIVVEYSRDFRGKMKSREVIIEFHKGEVE